MRYPLIWPFMPVRRLVVMSLLLQVAALRIGRLFSSEDAPNLTTEADRASLRGAVDAGALSSMSMLPLNFAPSSMLTCGTEILPWMVQDFCRSLFLRRRRHP